MNYRSSKLAALILLPFLALAGCDSPREKQFKAEIEALEQEYKATCYTMSNHWKARESGSLSDREYQIVGNAYDEEYAKLRDIETRKKRIEDKYGIDGDAEWRCASFLSNTITQKSTDDLVPLERVGNGPWLRMTGY